MLRRERWMSTAELADRLEKVHERLAGKSIDTRRRYVIRLVQRLERRDGAVYMKRVGSRNYVNRTALESLLPSNETLSGLGQSLAELRQKHEALQKQVNGHGSRLRVIEQKQALTAEFLAKYSALDRT